MKIGVFDSGLGGLLMLRAIVKKLPRYHYVYLGDTLRVPYGNRSQEAIYQFTKEAMDYLFSQGCQLVIIACNTASTHALRRLQREYLPEWYPDRRILGVIIPTVEAVLERADVTRIGVLATQATVASKAFVKEFRKRSKKQVFQQAAPLLVPLIENNAIRFSEPILREYLRPLIQKRIQTLVLGCTHYPLVRSKIQKIMGSQVRIISQADIVPKKLAHYLARHPEIETRLKKEGTVRLYVTDVTPAIQLRSKTWFGQQIVLKKVVVPVGADAGIC